MTEIAAAPLFTRIAIAFCVVLVLMAFAATIITEPKPPTMTLQRTALRWLEFVAWAAIVGGVVHFGLFMAWSFAHWVRTGT